MNKQQNKRFKEVMSQVKMETWKKSLLKSSIDLLMAIQKETKESDDKFYPSLKLKGKDAVMEHLIRYVITGKPKPKKKK